MKTRNQEPNFIPAVALALLFHAALVFVLQKMPVHRSPSEAAFMRVAKSPITVRLFEEPGPSKSFSGLQGIRPPKNKGDNRIMQTDDPVRPPRTLRASAAAPSPNPPAAAEPMPSMHTQLQADATELSQLSSNFRASLANLDRFLVGGGGAAIPGGTGTGNEGTGQGDGAGVYFDTRGYDLGPWADHMIAIVKSNWIIPEAAKLGMKGVVSIRFELDRTGKLIDLQILSSSQIPSFDSAAFNALRTSSPFPALPADFPLSTLRGVFRFFYNMLPEKHMNEPQRPQR